MPTLTVAGHDVTVGDEFLKLSPEDQQSMVNHISQHLPEKSNEPSGVGAGLQHGIAGAISGDTSTAKLSGVPTATLDAAASAVEPSNYKSAPLIREGGHWYNPMDYQPSAIPQMVAEAAPGMAQDMAAGWTSGKLMPGGPVPKALAGAGGYAGSLLLRTFGPGAHSNADARTGIPNSPVETSDIMREAAKQAMTLPINMVGGKMLLPAAGNVTGSVLSRLGKTIGTEGLVGGATDALDQAGTTAGSKGGFNIDGNQVATSATSRAIGGAVMASPRAAKEANANRKYSGYEATPETTAAAQAVATRIKDATDGASLVGPLGGTKNAASGVVSARDNIHRDLADATKNEALSTDNANTLSDINDGKNVSAGQVTKLQAEASPETMHLAHQAMIVRQEIARGSLTMDEQGNGTKFTGGIGGAMENLPIIRTPLKSAVTTSAAALAASLGVHGAGAAIGAAAPALLGAAGGLYGGARIIDRLTGSRSPAVPFVDRFGGTDTPTRFAPAAPAPPEPSTTSVPQLAPPQDTQLWGAPKPPGPTLGAQNADIQGMLRMAAARRNAAAAQQAASAPPAAPGIDAAAQNADIQGMLRMAAARRDISGKQQAQALAAESPAINDQGGLSALDNPAFAKHGSALLKAATVMKNLTAQPEDAAPPAAPEQPSFNPTALAMLKQKLKIGLPPAPEPQTAQAPVVPAAPQTAPEAPAALSMEQLLKNMRNASAAKAAMNPAATPPGGVVAPPSTAAPSVAPPVEAAPAIQTPPVSTLKKLKGNGTIKETKGPTEYMDPDTGETLTHTPKVKADLYGKDWTHEQFAKHEADAKIAAGELKANKRYLYENVIIRDRLSRERELQLLSQHEAAPDDTALAKLLLQELHHTRSGDEARSAIKFYASHMSPAMRKASEHLMSRNGPFSHMWSK